VATALTAPDGTWSAAPPAQRSGVFRAVYLGAKGDSPGTISNVAWVTVTPVVTLTASRRSGTLVDVSGTVAPAKKKVTVTAYRGGEKAAAKTLKVTSGSFSGTVALPKPGPYSIVASVAADAASAAGRVVVKLPASPQK
jgi:hypothetical protein